jgi:hypothetical protein
MRCMTKILLFAALCSAQQDETRQLNVYKQYERLTLPVVADSSVARSGWKAKDALLTGSYEAVTITINAARSGPAAMRPQRFYSGPLRANGT